MSSLPPPPPPPWHQSPATDRVEDAQASLEWLRGSAADVDFELDAIQRNFEIAKQESSSLKDLFRRQYAKPFLLAMGLMLFQQLSGINAVIFYTVSIFKMSGSTINNYLSTIIVGVVNLLSTFLANVLIDRLGRKILLYVSSVLIVLSLVALGTFFYIKVCITAFTLLFCVFFSFLCVLFFFLLLRLVLVLFVTCW